MEEEEDLFVLDVSRDSPIGECYIISSTYKIEIVTFYKTYTVKEDGMRLRGIIQSESRIHKRHVKTFGIISIWCCVSLVFLDVYQKIFIWCKYYKFKIILS